MVISCAVPSLIITKSKQGKKSKDKSIFDLTLNKRNGSNRRPEKCRPCELLQPAFQLRLCGGCAGGWRETDTWRGIWSRAWVGLTVTLNGPPPCPAAMPIHSHSHLPQSHPNPRPLPDAPPCMSPTSFIVWAFPSFTRTRCWGFSQFLGLWNNYWDDFSTFGKFPKPTKFWVFWYLQQKWSFEGIHH